MRDKKSPVQRYNEIAVMQYFYPEGVEGIQISEHKQIWEQDFDYYLRGSASDVFFVEAVFTADLDRAEEYIEGMLAHAAQFVHDRRKRTYLDMNYPFRKITNIPALTANGFEYTPHIDLWAQS